MDPTQADNAMRDLILQTGPIGVLIFVLGGLVRSWLTRILDQLASLATQVADVIRMRHETHLEVRDLVRRVERLEQSKGAAP